MPTLNAGVGAIALGPDKNYWFVETRGNKIGEIDATTHVITEYPLYTTPNAGLAGITAGSDGNVWFTEQNASKVGVLNLKTHAISEFSLNPGDSPYGITTGADGNVWFTESGSNQLGTIDVKSHAINTFVIATGGRRGEEHRDWGRTATCTSPSRRPTPSGCTTRSPARSTPPIAWAAPPPAAHGGPRRERLGRSTSLGNPFGPA